MLNDKDIKALSKGQRKKYNKRINQEIRENEKKVVQELLEKEYKRRLTYVSLLGYKIYKNLDPKIQSTWVFSQDGLEIKIKGKVFSNELEALDYIEKTYLKAL